MKYRFEGEKLRLIRYEITVPSEDGESHILDAVSESERDGLLKLYPSGTVTEVDNSGYEWLDEKTFTQEEQRRGEIENALNLGQENYEKYITESDPTYQMLELDMRVALLEMGVNLDDIQLD